ncbi:MAG: glycerol-3-phosphate acyltransferase [Steroidobacteraceae bacterium]|nr:glycerol-3-phosphate acyltransferase [Steroidobacteraceae bacterium]
MFELALKSLFAYLLGSLMGALIAGRVRGVDIRRMGSGNAGGTNALRTQGFGFALAVVVVDVGKALVAVGLLPGLDIPGVGLDPAVDRIWLAVACATAVVAGHVWPLYHDFQGGKGAATLVGAVAVLQPLVLAPIFLLWLVVVMLTGFVGLATMLACATLPVAFAAIGGPGAQPLVAFGIAMAVFIAWTHRANIVRMRAGTENRARRLWLLRPRDAGR